MAREKKKAVLPTNWLIVVGIACFFLAAAPCGYVWNKTQIHTLGAQIRHYEQQLEAAKLKRESLDRTWAAMLSPADLDDRVKRMRLEIGPPQPDQFIRLPDAPAPTRATPIDERQYAHRSVSTEEGRN